MVIVGLAGIMRGRLQVGFDQWRSATCALAARAISRSPIA
jgi:hypothetical protein